MIRRIRVQFWRTGPQLRSPEAAVKAARGRNWKVRTAVSTSAPSEVLSSRMPSLAAPDVPVDRLAARA
jgi:hypothetical protein